MGLTSTRSIERIGVPSVAEFHRRYVRPRVPVVIEGGALDLGAMQRWNSRYLQATAGHRRVPVEVSPDREFAVPGRIGYDLIRTRFERYINYLLNGDVSSRVTYYLAQLDVERYLPELLDDVERPSFVPRTRVEKPPCLWMGIGRNASTLHYDSYDNLYAMISGRKHITLFPPGDRPYLYPYEHLPKHRHFSRVNLRRPDLDRFPGLRYTRPLECVLCRGDVLYIPERWWHYLRSHGLNIAVNWWWVEG